MKKRTILHGITALAAAIVIGFLMACPMEKKEDPKPQPKSITITGTGKAESSNVTIQATPEGGETQLVVGTGTIEKDGSVMFPLLNREENNQYTGTGSFTLMLEFSIDNTTYTYTDGSPLGENKSGIKAVSITEASTTIAFDKFKEVISTP